MFRPWDGRLPRVLLREGDSGGMNTCFKVVETGKRSGEREGASLEKEVSDLFLKIRMVQSKSSDRPGRELGGHIVPPGTTDRSMIREPVLANNKRTLDVMVELKRKVAIGIAPVDARITNRSVACHMGLGEFVKMERSRKLAAKYFRVGLISFSSVLTGALADPIFFVFSEIKVAHQDREDRVRRREVVGNSAKLPSADGGRGGV